MDRRRCSYRPDGVAVNRLPANIVPRVRPPLMKSTSARPETRSQAERIFAKFNGARGLYEALERHGKRRDITAIYRWTYPKAKGGTNGLVPASAMPDVVLVARLEGIVLTPEDTHPEQRATEAPQED